MLAKMEFQFIELMSRDSVKEMSRTVDVFSPLLQTKATKRLFVLG